MGLMDFHKKEIEVPQTEAQLAKARAYYQDYPEMPFISKHRDLTLWLKKVAVDGSYLVPKRNMERLAGDVLPGDIIVLWRVQFGTLTNESIMPQYFEYNYGIDAYQALADLIAKGHVRVQNSYENLELHPATALKAILKAKNIKVPTGTKKAGLVDLVKANFSEAELEQHLHVKGYQITKSGEQLLKTHTQIVDKHPKKKY